MAINLKVYLLLQLQFFNEDLSLNIESETIKHAAKCLIKEGIHGLRIFLGSTGCTISTYFQSKEKKKI